MRDGFNDVLNDVTQGLHDIARGRMRPEQAQSRLTTVRKQHREASIDLVWEEEALDGSLHYDALIRPAGEEVIVSVSVCADDVLPWPLRGLNRWRDSDLLQVNGVVMSVESAIQQLDVLWTRKPLMQRVVDSCLIETELERRGIEVTPADVQSAFDDMRRQRGLLTVEQMKRWLQDSGTSLHTLHDLAARLARGLKLRDVVVGAQVDDYFAAHADEFDQIDAIVANVPDSGNAVELVKVGDGSADGFMEAARRLFVGSRGDECRIVFRKESRYKLARELGTQMHPKRGAGQTIGPAPQDDGYAVAFVLSVEVAKPGPATRGLVKTKLFEDWLREQRRTARINWLWGESQHTAQVGADC